MDIMTTRTEILERNIFLEKILTYQIVFKEYFKTMSLIERGEVLKYETYSRLSNNFLRNVNNYLKLGKSFIESHQLENSKIEESLNNYCMDLIHSLNCMDVDNNQLDHDKLIESKKRIAKSGDDFVNNIRVGIN